MDAHARKGMRRELIFVFGSLSGASQSLDIDYFRISRAVNGWVELTSEEKAKIKEQIKKRKKDLATSGG